MSKFQKRVVAKLALQLTFEQLNYRYQKEGVANRKSYRKSA